MSACIEEEVVYEELCRIDPHKPSGPDNLPGRLLKEGAPWLVKPICDLMNASLQTGCLPRDWISANVFPVFKKGNKHVPTNYRPVSLTSLVVKVMERTHVFCIKGIVDFLFENNKLSEGQHGFWSGRSCQTQLLTVVHDWVKSLDKGYSTHVLFLDFSKAFDSVTHQRLLLKIEQLGISGYVLKWIKALLVNRR